MRKIIKMITNDFFFKKKIFQKNEKKKEKSFERGFPNLEIIILFPFIVNHSVFSFFFSFFGFPHFPEFFFSSSSHSIFPFMESLF